MKKTLVLLLCLTVLYTTGLPYASYSNVRLQKTNPYVLLPSVGSSVPLSVISHLATEPAATEGIFIKATENLKQAPQDTNKILRRRHVRDTKRNVSANGNEIHEHTNSQDTENSIIENLIERSQQYDYLESSVSSKVVHEFDDDDSANGKFNYNKFNGISMDRNSENEDDLEKSNSFVGVYRPGCCGGWGGGNGGWGSGNGGWGSGNGGWGGGNGGWGSGNGGWGGGYGGWGGGYGGWGGGWGGWGSGWGGWGNGWGEGWSGW